MNLETIPYIKYEENLPQSGKYIVGQKIKDDIIVYQAFNPKIASYAIEHQKFGGDFYRFSRMTWIKPNFLWMMYRAGWAMKEHQQRILAIRIPFNKFQEILKEAVHSSYIEELYTSKENWQNMLSTSEVRLQWDPDHDPNGNKLSRKAIQLGLRGDVLKKFAQEWIIEIKDITPFAHLQKQLLDQENMRDFLVIKEKIIEITDPVIRKKIGLD